MESRVESYRPAVSAFIVAGMRWWNFTFAGALLSVSSCSTDNGQTGSIGYACGEDDCTQTAKRFLSRMSNRETPKFVGSRCRDANLGPADTESLGVRHCQCLAADGTIWPINATDAGLSSNCYGSEETSPGSVVSTGPCLAWGRGHLACVYPASEPHGCVVADPDSCEPICARLQQGLEADAAYDYDVELRSTSCHVTEAEQPPSSGRCLAIARINGACYMTTALGFYGPKAYDCALSDEQIFASFDPGACSASG